MNGFRDKNGNSELAPTFAKYSFICIAHYAIIIIFFLVFDKINCLRRFKEEYVRLGSLGGGMS